MLKLNNALLNTERVKGESKREIRKYLNENESTNETYGVQLKQCLEDNLQLKMPMLKKKKDL